MSAMEQFLLRWFDITGRSETGDCFFWRTDGNYAPVTILANCNDLFWWACADAEAVTPENIDVLAQSIADITVFYEAWRSAPRDDDRPPPPLVMRDLGVLLFCCRVRSMRPQGAFYKHFPPGVRELFDAAGPDRDPCDPVNTSCREYEP